MTIIKQLFIGGTISAVLLATIIPIEAIGDYKQFRTQLGKYDFKVYAGLISVTQQEYTQTIKAMKHKHEDHILCGNYISTNM